MCMHMYVCMDNFQQYVVGIIFRKAAQEINANKKVKQRFKVSDKRLQQCSASIICILSRKPYFIMLLSQVDTFRLSGHKKVSVTGAGHLVI